MATPELSPSAIAVRRYDPDRFFTALFAPPARRETLFLLYAFNHELARARAVASEPMLALIRLQWWREVVEGETRRHELATPLAAALAEGRLAREDLLEMIEGREMEAAPSLPTRAEWREYVEKSAGAVAVAAGRILGAEGAEINRLRSLGTAYGVAATLRSVVVLARAGRCMLPEDVLGRHGLTVHDVIAEPGRAAPVLSELARGGQTYLDAGRGRYRRPIRAAALSGVFARRDLVRATPVSSGTRGLGARLAVLLSAVSGRV